MLQERDVIPLMEHLLDADYQVLLETSGERPLGRVPKQVVKIVDVKCPIQVSRDTFALENLDALRPHDELKLPQQTGPTMNSPAISSQTTGWPSA